MHQHRTIALWVTLLAAGLVFAGCCGKVEKQLKTCKDDLASATAKLGNAKAKIGDLEKQLEQTKGELAASKHQADALSKQLKALGQKVADVRNMSQEEKERMKKELEETRAQLEKLRLEKEKALARTARLRKLLERFGALIRSGKIKVRLRDGRMVVVLASEILFPPNRVKLKKAGRQALQEIVKVLKTVTNRKFQVAGHTDNERTRRYKSNWELSAMRAVNVVKFMQSEGMQPAQLAAVGYSQYSPVEKNDTKENRAKNRRIEIVLMPNLDELPNLKEVLKGS